ncbi:hypothetical protein B0H14DRAFT_3493782 [Mycena olivaceomarginata]|nr:hypothetical protein B0H14DRAFT_3493782 [Mycena olivaceomarginata]
MPPQDHAKRRPPKERIQDQPGTVAENEAAAKAAQEVTAAKRAGQKQRGRPPKQALPLADVTNNEASGAGPTYSITNNNRARARQAAADAQAAEKEEAKKAHAAQIAKGWMPGSVEGTVVLLRARKPQAHPDGTLPPRVGEVAARRLDACEKALLERAAAAKRKAAAAPSSSKAPSRKKRKA